MLKRLIIAVFGISLVLALSSNILAGPDAKFPAPKGDAPTTIIPSNPKFTHLQDARPVQPTFKKPVSARHPLPPGTPPLAPPTLIYFCDLQDYSVAPAYFWTIPDIYGDNFFNTRFTVEAGFECTLKVAHIAMYRPAMVGTPDLRVYLWADDGFGFPGAVLDSVTIPNALLPLASLAYANADFSAAGWVFSDGDEYHYGWTTVGAGTLACTSDDATGPYAGEERSSEYSSGAWGSMLNDWGLDVTFNMVSERCCNEIPFSDCYVQSYWTNIAYFWRAPHPVFGDTAYAQRFDVGGPETLQSVDIYIYGGGGSGGNEAVHITVYDDDGFGFPGAQRAQVTLPGFSYALFPAVQNVSFAPLVLENSFHVAFSSAGVAGVSWESCLSSDGTDGTGRSSSAGDCSPGWDAMLSCWGVDVNFLFDAYLCRDEFASCQSQNYAPVVDDSRAIPDGNPALVWAQKFTNAPTGSDCELRDVDLDFVRTAGDITAGRPLMYTYNTDIQVVADVGGYPTGALLSNTTLTPADYAAAGYTGSGFVGHFYITVHPNVSVPADYWVLVDPQAPTRATGIRHASDLFAGGGGVVNGMATLYGVDSTWYWLCDFFGGVACDGALNMTAKVCCIPFAGRTCTPPDEWAARSHDLRRSGASQLPIGDAWCDLNRHWFADELTAATAQTMGPMVHGNRAFQVLETSAGSSIRIFNLVSGVLEQTISGAALGNFIENDPLIIGNNLYIAGGDNRVISKWDISPLPAAPTMTWSRTLAAAVGPVRRANLLLVNVAGTNVLYGGSQTGRAFAILETTGADYPGWGVNPITLDAGQLVQGSATDGGLLYFGTRQAGLNGDVWAIDPAVGLTAGLPVWKLSTAGGYQGTTVYASVTSEAFPQISVEAGTLYVGGRETGNFPTDGLFYRLDAATGAVKSVTQCNGMLFSNPIIDINLVYCQTATGWVPSPLGGDMVGYNKSTGAIAWVSQDYMESGANPAGAIRRYFANGLLTCEPEPAPDIIVNADERGYTHFWNSLDGTELFRRRWDFGGSAASLNYGGGTAIGVDGSGAVHVLVGSTRGALVDLTKGSDRPRLEIQDFDPSVAVDFSLLTSVIYSVPNILTNTGCADLTINAVTVDVSTFGSTDPGVAPFKAVRPGLLDAATDLANQMASSAMEFKNFNSISDASILVADNNEMLTTNQESNRSERGYRAALTVPAYINSVLEPYAGEVVAAGDTIPLTLDVNPTNISRGPQTFYIELNTDDPDYFLNAGSVTIPNDYPELIVTLIGGCVTDTTVLQFGAAGANHQVVFNSARIADGDYTPHGFLIDGQSVLVYQGSYIYGVSRFRIAFNSKDWSSGGGETNAWISIQADPNYCDFTCKPALTTGVSLGAMWNGASYTPISGNMICKSWIDSVQNFSNVAPTVDSTDWDWKNFGAPFDPTLTMGLTANTRTIGALNTPELANLTVEIFNLRERNGNSVNNWKMGLNIDYDVAPNLGGVDTAVVDRNVSAAWTTASAGSPHFAYGFIKLPFGCGETPLKNAKGLDASQGHFIAAGGAANGDGYMDSAYAYMSLAPGGYSHTMTGSPDQQIHGTLVEHNFGPNGTYTFGVALFGYNSGITDPRHPNSVELSATARLVNKWVGFGRGDVNNDNAINLGDIMVLSDIINGSVPGAIPFQHLADVNADTAINGADLTYLINYYFHCGPCPQGNWVF